MDKLILFQIKILQNILLDYLLLIYLISHFYHYILKTFYSINSIL